MRMNRPALTIVILLLGGCQAMDRLAKPSASIKGVHLQDFTLQAATLLFDVEVANPYSVPLPLADIEYRLASAGKTFLSGQAPVSGSVPAGGKRVLPVPARVTFSDFLAIMENIHPGELVPYSAALGLTVQPPGVGPLHLDLNKEGEFPIPTVPEVSLDRVEWQTLTLDQAGATLHVRVKNTNRFPIDLSRLAYALNLGGTQVAQSAVEKKVAFAAGNENVLELPMSLSPKRLGLAVFNVLLGSGSGYALKGSLDLDTPFGPIKMPYEKSGETTFSK